MVRCDRWAGLLLLLLLRVIRPLGWLGLDGESQRFGGSERLQYHVEKARVAHVGQSGMRTDRVVHRWRLGDWATGRLDWGTVVMEQDGPEQDGLGLGSASRESRSQSVGVLASNTHPHRPAWHRLPHLNIQRRSIPRSMPLHQCRAQFAATCTELCTAWVLGLVPFISTQCTEYTQWTHVYLLSTRCASRILPTVATVLWHVVG